ncbi:maleylpyruvate isomerase family mycothiol-dependent enzyme [Amycolatopsis palatopharyngis]|uniref:maleylpyruvate isomerase family mycothiol-dependent enzyme n=1 Tax=Amycolatopsis palatopharyngis TaxID=187982 RepID=UPI000E2560DB|nr:maleylpyruvate isomerase family mycothiol-dependent enzyme [Amycolatopsis palatopharyngis]
MYASEYTSALRRDGAMMAGAAGGALDRDVPACPGWTVGDLVWHTGEVHFFWRQIASGALAGPEKYTEPDRPADEELLDWFNYGVANTAATLERLSPEQPVWTWAPSRQDAGFVQRRMAQETAVHCWDILSATGGSRPLDRELAVDGIDEFLDHFLPAQAPEDLSGGVHLHATDGPGEWLIRADAGVWVIDRAHAKGAVAVRGTASDLLLLLWRRLRPAAVEILGDEDVCTSFLGLAALD